MKSTAVISDAPVARIRVQIPSWGAWWADVDTVSAVELSGRVTIQLADVSLVGTIVSGGPRSDGQSSFRVVGGAGGWGKSVKPKGYEDSAGVKVSDVLSDLARSAGESIASVPATRLGPHYARRAGPAFATLGQLAPASWHVGLDGVTRIELRAPTTYEGSASVVHRNPAAGVVELEPLGSWAGLLPGVSVDGGPAASDVELVLDADEFVVRVFSRTELSRSLKAFADLMSALDPRREFRGVFEYRVVSQSGERLNLQPVRSSSQLPDLAKVPVRPGMSGLRADVLPGALVLVVFADADPSRPQVISHDAPDAPGWSPIFLDLGENALNGAARQTDAVVAGMWGGTIVGPCSTKVRIG